jgi:hypothetical protein
MENIRIRDKHPGSATLVILKNILLTQCVSQIFPGNGFTEFLILLEPYRPSLVVCLGCSYLCSFLGVHLLVKVSIVESVSTVVFRHTVSVPVEIEGTLHSVTAMKINGRRSPIDHSQVRIYNSNDKSTKNIKISARTCA